MFTAGKRNKIFFGPQNKICGYLIFGLSIIALSMENL